MPKLEFLVDVSCKKIKVGRKQIDLNFPYDLHTKMSWHYSSICFAIGSVGPSDWLKEKTKDVKEFIKKSRDMFPKMGIYFQLEEGKYPFQSHAISLNAVNRRKIEPCYIIFQVPTKEYSLRIERH